MRRDQLAFVAIAATALSVWTVAAPAGNDFFQFWFAGHLVASGQSPYDQTAWARAASEFGPVAANVARNCPRPDAPACLWVYPPWMAWLLAPIGALPIGAGLVAERAVFALLLLAGAVATLVAAGIRRPLPALAIAGGFIGSAPFVRDLFAGHFEGALLVGLVLVLVALRREDPVILAAASLLLGLKAHLFIALAVAVVALLLARRQLRLLALSGVIVLAAVGLGIALEPASLAALAGSPSKAALTGSSTWSFAATFGDAAPLVAALILAVSLLGAFKMVMRARADERLFTIIASGAALSLATAPYVQSYDHVLLLPCLAVAAARPRAPAWLTIALVMGAFAAASWWAYALELGGSALAFAALLPPMALVMAGAATAPRARS